MVQWYHTESSVQAEFLKLWKNSHTGLLFFPQPMFSVLIDLRSNMFRNFAEEYASDTVPIDINYDVSIHEGDSGNNRLQVEIFNCILPKNCPSVFFLFLPGRELAIV